MTTHVNWRFHFFSPSAVFFFRRQINSNKPQLCQRGNICSIATKEQEDMTVFISGLLQLKSFWVVCVWTPYCLEVSISWVFVSIFTVSLWHCSKCIWKEMSFGPWPKIMNVNSLLNWTRGQEMVCQGGIYAGTSLSSTSWYKWNTNTRRDGFFVLAICENKKWNAKSCTVESNNQKKVSHLLTKCK